jgi:methylenetetrahydrofolate reductase (NADPH)
MRGDESALARALTSGRFVVTAELPPPVSADPTDFLRRARPLRGLAAAVNVTDGAGAKTQVSPLVAAHWLLGEGIEPVLQMTCRDRNRLALQADLIGAVALGVRNFLMLRGDDPLDGDQPETAAVFDLDSRALIETADRLRREARLPSGTPVKGIVPFLIGAADLPVDPPPGWTPPPSLVAKADAGAEFVQTQFCMDAGIARRYAARLAQFGLTERLKLLIGVAPIPSARSARWMKERLFGTIIPDATIARLEAAADPKQEGKRICVELLRELAQIPGIAGAHIMAPQNPAAIGEVIAEAGFAAG